jgi:hypothetical protein
MKRNKDLSETGAQPVCLLPCCPQHSQLLAFLSECLCLLSVCHSSYYFTLTFHPVDLNVCFSLLPACQLTVLGLPFFF